MSYCLSMCFTPRRNGGDSRTAQAEGRSRTRRGESTFALGPCPQRQSSLSLELARMPEVECLPMVGHRRQLMVSCTAMVGRRYAMLEKGL